MQISHKTSFRGGKKDIKILSVMNDYLYFLFIHFNTKTVYDNEVTRNMSITFVFLSHTEDFRTEMLKCY